MTLASLIGLVDAMESRSRRRRSARATSKSGKVRALLLSLCLRSHLENRAARRSAIPRDGEESKQQLVVAYDLIFSWGTMARDARV